MADDLEFIIEIDSEWVRVRDMRERNYVKAGIDPFVAFRLALIPDLDWHKVVVAKERGATDAALVDLYID